MGARATKHQTGNATDQGGNNLVTRFTISDESGPPLSIDQVFRAALENKVLTKQSSIPVICLPNKGPLKELLRVVHI